MAKVLLMDDDKSLHLVMKRILEEAGHNLISAYDGSSGLKILEEQNPDLLVLDVMMPNTNGFDVCKKVRESGKRLPIIFLSAKGDIVDKSIGFKAGGDDYIVKPFDNEELLLRIDAHLRRHNEDLAFSRAVNREGSSQVGDLEIFFKQYKVTLKGVEVDLTSKEFEILALLAANPGQVYTRQQIYNHIWGAKSSVDENSITVFMRKIREKIEENPSQPKYILTVWRVGYKFTDSL